MAQHIFSGSGVPSSTPTAIGQHYIDTTTKVSYISVGTTSPADWESSDSSGAIAAHVADLDPHSQYTTNAEAQFLIDIHANNTLNPHSVTKSQIGLGNADNTSDVNKPVSTAQQAALDLKLTKSLNLSDVSSASAARSNLGLGDVAIENVLPIAKGGTGQVNATAALNNLLPDQTGQSGKVLKTDGSNASWQTGGGGGGSWGSITGTLSDQTDLQGELDGKQNVIAETPNRAAVINSLGELDSIDSYIIDDTNSILSQVLAQPDGNTGGYDVFRTNLNITPQQDSPNETWHLQENQVAFDPEIIGFDLGTAGQAFRFLINNFVHNSTGNLGAIEFIQNNFSIGNGTDAIDFKGLGYMFGFGQVNANVNITGPLQGYGFQLNVDAAATFDAINTYLNGFYDYSNINCETPSYTSFAAGPNIDSLRSGTNYTGFSVNQTIDLVNDNAGIQGLAISGTVNGFGNNTYWQGVNINPTLTNVRYAAGLNVSMDSATPYVGLVSSLVFQDLTFTFNDPYDNNYYTLEYTPGGTAGSELVNISGNAIEVQIDSGVSTAAQVKASLEAIPQFNSAITITISGSGSNPQVTAGPTNFTGGANPGRILAAYLDGDVEITGALSFGGALSIGKLNAYASQTMVDGGGSPASIHGLITAPTVGDNITLTNADTIAVNTAALVSIGTNSSVSTSFIGVAALGLPAVLSMQTGSTLDRIYGALFALSLDVSGTGGTVDEVGLCRSVAIPNGVTTVNNLYGYLFDLPYGDPGTKTFGFYDRPGKNNYFAGNLVVGGTPGSDDLPTNSSVGIELRSTTKAILNSRMTTSERNALTAVNGMQVYNTTTDKLQVYAAGSWVDLH